VAEVPEQGKADFGVAGVGLKKTTAQVAAGGIQGAAVVTVGQGQALGQAGQVAVVGARLGRAAGMEVFHLDRNTLGRRVAATTWHGCILHVA